MLVIGDLRTRGTAPVDIEVWVGLAPLALAHPPILLRAAPDGAPSPVASTCGVLAEIARVRNAHA